MPRLMFDSTTPSAIPVTAELVGGYVNGQYAWSSADWNRFPGAQQVRINVTGDPALGNCLDVETGDATPEQAPLWYDTRHAAGTRFLAVYCNRATLPAVNAAMGSRSFYRWVATLDGTMRPNGQTYTAVQFAGASQAGINVDVSIVYDEKWHPSSAPSWAGDALTQAKAVITAATALEQILAAHA